MNNRNRTPNDTRLQNMLWQEVLASTRIKALEARRVKVQDARFALDWHRPRVGRTRTFPNLRAASVFVGQNLATHLARLERKDFDTIIDLATELRRINFPEEFQARDVFKEWEDGGFNLSLR